MDPQAAWNQMLDAIAANDFFEAAVSALTLLNWFDRGGFPPQAVTRSLPVEWERTICLDLCGKVLRAAKLPRK